MTAPSARHWTLRLDTSGGRVQVSLYDGDTTLAEESSPADSAIKLEQAAREALENGPGPDGPALLQLGRQIAGVGFPPTVALALLEAVVEGRVRLALDVGQSLQRIPWELAYLDEGGIGFLVQHPGVRLHRLSPAPPAGPPRDDIKVLLAYSDPQSARYPAIAGCALEFQSVLRALASPECKGVRVETLEHATASSLTRRLSGERFDIFHFIGHGDIKPTGGVLVLEGGEPNQDSMLYGEEMSHLLRGAGVRLAFLSCCKSAGSRSSVGTQLSIAGIPAVVGMQASISDVVAHLFARAFYSALAAGQSVEEAVYQGRMAVHGTSTGWFSPVLTAHDPGVCIASETKAAAMARGNLPRPLTSFVGRAREKDQVVELLQSERLVILLGSGGIGKTRLSIEIGRRCLDQFKHGVWQVQLDAVTEPAEVIPAIARVFEIRETTHVSVEQRLFEFLEELEMLIIFDNCEHLVEACRDAAVRLLSRCPGLKLLATSRIVLDTGAESIVMVPALSYPRLSPDVPLKFTVDEALERYEALQLLVARGKSASSKFAPSEQNLHALCRIAERVDGIPLALELAASLFRTHTPAEVSEDLALIDTPAPGAVPRHKTLRSTLDWSYRLLTFPEKALFARLSVFPGEFSAEGAEAVASADLEVEQVRGLLSNLVDRSLVLAEDGGKQMRYRLLDTCRLYALEILQKAGKSADTRNAFLSYMGSVAERLYEIELSHDVVRWLENIRPERENILAAFEWAMGEGNAPVQAATVLYKTIDYWYFLGAYAFCAQLVDRALQRLPEDQEELQIRLEVLAGAFAVYRGQTGGLDRMKAARQRALAFGDPNVLRSASMRLGECAYLAKDEETALEMFHWVIDHVKEIADPRREGYTRVMLGNILIHRGKLDEAADHIREALEMRERLGDHSGAGVARCTLAYLEQTRGSSQAAGLYAKGLRELATADNEYWLSAFLVLASSLLLDSHPGTAASIQGLAERLAEGSGFEGEAYVSDWAKEVILKTKTALGNNYLRLSNEGRTMNLEEALSALN